MNTLNISATLNVFRLLTRPTLCLPHATISTFNQLPIPLNSGFAKYKNVDIRAVVLDKDNCFAYPKENEVYKSYEVCFYVFLSLRLIYLSRFRIRLELRLDSHLIYETYSWIHHLFIFYVNI